MQEIASAEAIKSEILDDARKKAAKILAEADEEAAKEISDTEAKADEVVTEIVRENEAKAARYRMETMARFPLERTRMRTVFVSSALRDAARDYVAALGPELVASLAERMLEKGAAFLSGREVELRRRGLDEAAASRIASRALAGCASVRQVEDARLAAPGLVAATLDGAALVRATMDLVEERLLDEKRGELASGLCPGALEL